MPNTCHYLWPSAFFSHIFQVIRITKRSCVVWEVMLCHWVSSF